MSDWRKNLGSFFEKGEKSKQVQEGSELARFISGTVLPAFDDLSKELGKHGREVTIRSAVSWAFMTVSHGGEDELTYRVQGRIMSNKTLACADVRYRERKGLRLMRTESMFRPGNQNYSIGDITKEEVIRNFLDHYTRRVDLS